MNRKVSAVEKMGLAILSLGLVVALAGAAAAYTIEDVTLVGRGTTAGAETTFTWIDHIDENSGSPAGGYNIFGINTAFSKTDLKISLYSNFGGSDTAGGVSIRLADLALDLNHDKQYEYAVRFNYDNSGNITAALYNNIAGWYTSKYFLEGKTSSNYYYGEAWGNAGMNPDHEGQSPMVNITSGNNLGSIGFARTTLGPNAPEQPDYVYDVSVPYSLLAGIQFGEEVGIFWAGSTCANDIIEGTAPVPVPASAILLGSGLLGMLSISLRRKQPGTEAQGKTLKQRLSESQSRERRSRGKEESHE